MKVSKFESYSTQPLVRLSSVSVGAFAEDEHGGLYFYAGNSWRVSSNTDSLGVVIVHDAAAAMVRKLPAGTKLIIESTV